MAAEQLRQQLLKETGITCWFPRYALPGAAPSHDICINSPTDAVRPIDAVVHNPTPPKATAVERPVHLDAPRVKTGLSGSDATADVLKNLKTTAATVVTAVQQQVSAPQPNTASQAVPLPQVSLAIAEPFGFSWFSIDKRLSVLAMLPPGTSRVSSTCRTMLQRLLIALHEPWRAVTLDEQSFHWPFADDPDLLADANAASQAVDGFIARRLRAQRSTMLLVLSDQLPWFLQQSSADGDAQALGHLKIHRHYDLAMLCTYALHSMEQDAGLKRAAWHSMQVLRERLSRT